MGFLSYTSLFCDVGVGFGGLVLSCPKRSWIPVGLWEDVAPAGSVVLRIASIPIPAPPGIGSLGFSLAGLALQLPELFAGLFRYRLLYIRLRTPSLPTTHADAGNRLQ